RSDQGFGATKLCPVGLLTPRKLPEPDGSSVPTPPRHRRRAPAVRAGSATQRSPRDLEAAGTEPGSRGEDAVPCTSRPDNTRESPRHRAPSHDGPRWSPALALQARVAAARGPPERGRGRSRRRTALLRAGGRSPHPGCTMGSPEKNRGHLVVPPPAIWPQGAM